MRVFSGLTVFVLFAGMASAQPWSRFQVGFKGGLPVKATTEPLSDSRHFTMAPSVEYRVTDRISVDFSPMYKRLNMDVRGLVPTIEGDHVGIVNRARANAWEFPVAAKFSLLKRDSEWHPYLLTGYSFRKIWVRSHISFLSDSPLVSLGPEEYTTSTGVGAVFGGGIDRKIWKVRAGPELRYTRWGATDFGPRRDQADVLIGIRF